MKQKAWIAMDADGKIYIYYGVKPVKITLKGGWKNMGILFFPIKKKDLPDGVNPSWEDKKPIEVMVTTTITLKQ